MVLFSEISHSNTNTVRRVAVICLLTANQSIDIAKFLVATNSLDTQGIRLSVILPVPSIFLIKSFELPVFTVLAEILASFASSHVDLQRTN